MRVGVESEDKSKLERSMFLKSKKCRSFFKAGVVLCALLELSACGSGNSSGMSSGNQRTKVSDEAPTEALWSYFEMEYVDKAADITHVQAMNLSRIGNDYSAATTISIPSYIPVIYIEVGLPASSSSDVSTYQPTIQAGSGSEVKLAFQNQALTVQGDRLVYSCELLDPMSYVNTATSGYLRLRFGSSMDKSDGVVEVPFSKWVMN